MAPIQKTPKAQLKVEGFFIPADQEDWLELFKSAKLKNTLHTLPAEEIGSRSEVNHRQFVLLRAYWRPMKGPGHLQRRLGAYGLSASWEGAKKIIDEDREFQRYLELIKTTDIMDEIDKGHKNWPGSFKPVKVAQELLMKVGGLFDWDRTNAVQHHLRQQLRPRRSTKAVQKAQASNAPPTRSKSDPFRVSKNTTKKPKAQDVFNPPPGDSSYDHPPTEDEESVNIAMVLLLQNISDLFPKGTVEWVPNRHQFTVNLTTSNMKTVTDGLLRSKDGKTIFSILEAKKKLREDNIAEYKVQETAEMVGWVNYDASDTPNLNGRRILISQDRHELFITFATFDDDYVQYIRGKQPGHSYLKFKTFGPYDITDHEHVRMFAHAVLAFTMALNNK